MSRENQLILNKDNEFEWIKHPDEEIDLEGKDLNELFGQEWYRRIGYAEKGNTCLNKPDYIDSFGLFIFSIGFEKTCQLIFDETGEYTCSRKRVDGEWSNWEIFNPVPDPLTYAPSRDMESGVIEKDGDREVFFSTSFLETPLVFLTPIGSSYCYVESISEAGFKVSSNDVPIQWLAIERD